MARHEVYAFGPFRLDVGDRRLSQGDATIHLAPKAHDVLVALVRDAGRLVTKHDLLARVWADAFVEEGILAVHVSSLRKALRDTHRPPVYIETVSRSGYRFIAPIARVTSGRVAPAGDAPHPPEALALVGRGRSHLFSASYFELPEAVSAFQSAIDIDPAYAAAHAGLALARCAQASLRAAPHVAAYTDAKASALRALALDHECADAQVALGVVLFLSEWDWIGAERSLRRALQLSPGHPEACVHYGSLLEALGQLDEGLRMKEMALERHPASPFVLVGIASSYWHQRRYGETRALAHRALECDARHLLARELLVGAYMKQGDFDAAMRESVTQAESFGAPGEAIANIKALCVRLEAAYASGGSAAVARCALRETPAAAAADGAAAIRLAVLSADGGYLDAAFVHLDRAIESRDPSLVHLAVAPQWDGLREDPRFRDRLSRMRIPFGTSGPISGST
jgi:DNA-binding winged helix-turn-helix (wHTH) protein/Tfp pilus assembly protein PilF